MLYILQTTCLKQCFTLASSKETSVVLRLKTLLRNIRLIWTIAYYNIFTTALVDKRTTFNATMSLPSRLIPKLCQCFAWTWAFMPLAITKQNSISLYRRWTPDYCTRPSGRRRADRGAYFLTWANAWKDAGIYPRQTIRHYCALLQFNHANKHGYSFEQLRNYGSYLCRQYWYREIHQH